MAFNNHHHRPTTVTTHADNESLFALFSTVFRLALLFGKVQQPYNAIDPTYLHLLPPCKADAVDVERIAAYMTK
jgi:hypothetical protein